MTICQHGEQRSMVLRLDTRLLLDGIKLAGILSRNPVVKQPGRVDRANVGIGLQMSYVTAEHAQNEQIVIGDVDDISPLSSIKQLR